MDVSVKTTRMQRQRGGVAILVALVLLVVMSVAAFGLSRSTLRELFSVGTVVQGTKAAEAAEAGIDWFITWSEGNNQVAAIGSKGGNALLSQSMVNISDTGWSANAYPAGVTKHWTTTGMEWDRAFTITSALPSSGSDANEMVFDTTKSVVKQTEAAGNSVIQKFDVSVRFLGFMPTSLTTGGGNPSGGTALGSQSQQDLLWQVVSTGTANIKGASLAFTQRREAIVQASLGQSNVLASH